MKIRLGLALDGANHLAPGNRLGEWTTGPKGLLAQLELELGFAAPAVSHTTRVMQYASALEQADNGERFYSASRSVDPLGVAETLLDWRDALFDSCWHGVAPHSSPQRLLDLAEVERHAASIVAPGVAQRLVAVASALAAGVRTQITEIEMVDPPEVYPPVWRRVLERLPTTTVSPLQTSTSAPDLAALQAQLVGDAPGEAAAKATHDGSVRLLRVSALPRDARVVITWLHAQADAVVVSSDVESLAEGCIAQGLPAPGWSSHNAARPALQLLPLALQLRWAPLDVAALLSFLSHPLCPLDRRLASQLARVVAAEPGIGGSNWREAIEAFSTRHPDTPADKTALANWVECNRFAANQGMPAEVARQVAEQLAASLGRRARTTEEPTEREALMAAVVQCHDFSGAIDLLGKTGTALQPTQIQQMLDLASLAAPTQGAAAELGHTPLARQPGALIETRDTVLWWLARPEASLQPSPWSATEIASLQAAGVELPDAHALLRQRIQEWLRPIRSARKQIVIVLPPEGEEAHPTAQIAMRTLERLRIEPVETLLAECPGAQTAIPRRPLPGLSRWWQLPPGAAIAKRTVESYSSLKTLLDNPYQWVLHYAAHIRPGALPTLPDVATLGGQLMHRLSEQLFARPDWRDFAKRSERLDAWCDEAFERLVDEEGALLRQPGKQAELARLRATARRAMRVLLDQFHKAGVTHVATEMPVAGVFCGGQIQGYADLVVSNAKNERAIVDLKLSGKRHAEALRDNKHLQLTIYARLLGQGGYLPTAYYLLSTQDLIAQDQGYFPNARKITNRSDENVAQLWTRFETSWKRRRKQLDAGEVEVVTEATADMAEPANADDEGLPGAKPFDRYNPYLVLAGWEQGA